MDLPNLFFGTSSISKISFTLISRWQRVLLENLGSVFELYLASHTYEQFPYKRRIGTEMHMYIFVSMLTESFEERRSAGFWKSMWAGQHYKKVKCPHESTKPPCQGEKQENIDVESLVQIEIPVAQDSTKSPPEP